MELCAKRGLAITNVAEVFGGKARMSYAMRGRSKPGRRGAVLTYTQLAALSGLLKANRAETRKLILLGLLDDTQPHLRSCVIALLHENLAFAERLNIPMSDFDFSGKENPLPDLG